MRRQSYGPPELRRLEWLAHPEEHPIDARTGKASAGNARLAYTTAGNGDAVVLVHAGIADRFRTVTFDMRGFGESEMVDEPFSFRADLAALLDALEIERAHIVGCSMGGSVALAFAIDYPDRAAGIVQVNAGAPGFVPEGGYFEPPQWERAVAAVEEGCGWTDPFESPPTSPPRSATPSERWT